MTGKFLILLVCWFLPVGYLAVSEYTDHKHEREYQAALNRSETKWGGTKQALVTRWRSALIGSPDALAYAMTICGGEVAADAPVQEKLRVLMVAENRARMCGTSVQEELFKEARDKNTGHTVAMFSPWGGKGLTINKLNIQQQSACITEAFDIMIGSREPGFDATFFHATHIRPKWDKRKMELVDISGGHEWYRSDDRTYCLAKLPEPTGNIPELKPVSRKQPVLDKIAKIRGKLK